MQCTEVLNVNGKIYFDMDGTIANLYGVDGWLQDLINEDTRPYKEAKPLINMQVLARRLNKLQKQGYKIGIISWLSKCGSDEYNQAVTQTKLKWLHTHLKSVDFDEIHIVKYGTPKHTLGQGILFDDEKPNRDKWGQGAYDVDRILEILKGF